MEMSLASGSDDGWRVGAIRSERLFDCCQAAKLVRWVMTIEQGWKKEYGLAI